MSYSDNITKEKGYLKINEYSLFKIIIKFSF